MIPYVNGVDLNCGCPQTWACAANLGAALMENRELVRDMLVETRGMMQRDGWERDKESSRGRSLSVKIRIHKDLRYNNSLHFASMRFHAELRAGS